MSKTGYVVFAEDKTYLLWQTELFIKSLTTRGGVPIENIVVLFADPSYFVKDNELTLSPYLQGMMSSYPGIKFHCVQNFGRRNWYFRFKDNGTWEPKQYPGLNKWTSLCEAANAGWLDTFEEIVLLEQDLWFSGPFPELPPGNCVTQNWINNRYRAFEVTDKSDDMNTPGLDLDDIMKLCKVTSTNREKWVGGAIIFKFITTQLKQSKFLNSIINYNQLLMTLGELCLPQGSRHETDMVAPNLAMAHCGMDCTLIDDLRWRSDVWTWHEEPPAGVVVHYGWDFNNYPHLKSTFSKFKWSNEVPWNDTKELIKDRERTTYKWVKEFVSDIISLKEIEINRDASKPVAIPVI